MTDAEKVAYIKSELERVIFPDETDDSDGYWMMVESHCDNATGVICDWDQWHKNMLEIINK